MPKAFDTELTAQSINAVPKGLKQVFCLIRALVNEPQVLLFDEATSSLDLNTC